MKINEGKWDRALRVTAGIVLISLAFVGPQTAWGYVGLIPLLTGITGFCPIYRLLRISTACKKIEDRSQANG